jgi:hypothetical protein
MRGTEKKRAYRGATFDSVCVAALITYFLYFALPAVRGGFREDEMMNITVYWRAGMLKSLLANVTFLDGILSAGRRSLLPAAL